MDVFTRDELRSRAFKLTAEIENIAHLLSENVGNAQEDALASELSKRLADDANEAHVLLKMALIMREMEGRAVIEARYRIATAGQNALKTHDVGQTE